MSYEKASREDKLSEAQAKITAAVESLVTGEDWVRFLQQSRKFHKYSVNNLFLILAQTGGTATRVAGYKTWQSLDRQVRKGEKGITILAPRTFTKVEQNATGEDVERKGLYFTTAKVFDVSQTDGEPLAEDSVQPVLLDSGEGRDLWHQLTEQVLAQGYSIERCSHIELGGANGDTNYAIKRVRVRDDVSQLQATKTLAHELAHIVLGHCEDGRYVECRGQREVEAESTAFLVLDAAGLTSDDYTFGYVAHWAKGEVDIVKASAQAVVQAASTITSEWGDAS